MFSRKVTAVLGVALMLIASWIFRADLMSMMRWFSNFDAVTTDMRSIGLFGPIVLFILFVLQVFLAFIPGQALMVACGYLYGFWGGFLLSWLSLVFGGEMAFVLARRYGRHFAERWVSSQVLSRWDKTAQGQGITFFTISLVLPLIPNDAMCYVAGLGKISRPRFVTANLLGRGIACVLTSAAGAFGGTLPWQIWVVLLTIFLLIGLGWRIMQNRKSKTTFHKETP
ncbi:MAG TPA: VTT domain-containing protein [Anaerolineales bacterium]|nr:VTT domain-containing protein [Anaerolineales bacterium]